MVDIPINSSCSVELTDAENADESDKCETNPAVRSHSNFCERYMCIILAVVGSILMVEILLKLMFFLMLIYNVDNAAVSPTSHMEREHAIKLDYTFGKRSTSEAEEAVIDEDPSFDDQTELANRITQVERSDAFPMINGARFKRETSRARRDCDQDAEKCKMLLQTVQNYLVALSLNTGNTKFVDKDILNCLRCRNMRLAITDASESAPQSKDQYFPHDYVEQNRSGDSGIAVIKLLNDRETKGDPKQTEVNRTEALAIQTAKMDSVQNEMSQNAANQSSKKISETTTVSVDHINFNVTENNENSTMSINDDKPGNISVANDSHIKVQSNESIPVTAHVNREHGTTASSKVASNSTIILQISSTESSVRTAQYSATMNDAISTIATIVTNTTGSMGSTSTRNYIDLVNHTAIIENVTSVPVGHNVTGISNDDSTLYPSMHPPFAGHPENQSAANMNDSNSRENYRASDDFPKIHDDRWSTTENYNTVNDIKSIQVATESTKSSEQLPLTSTWTMPQPVCFWGNPSQFSTEPSSSRPYENRFDFFPSQSNGMPSQDSQDSQPYNTNNIQIKTNTVQFMQRSQGQSVDSAGAAMSNAPISVSQQPITMNQQPTVTTRQSSTIFQQPIAGMPYFCAYMTMNFGLPPGMSQSDRSSTDEAKNPPEQPSYGKDSITTWKEYPAYFSFNKCPKNYHQCNDLQCIPKRKWCDGHVDCMDVSDETRCSCRDRISRERICDGYFDCPHGEDELGCFDCPVDSFSCEDWDMRYSRDNCVPLSQRCDGIYQCPNGKDELNCNILSESILNQEDTFMVGFTQGYLHKNVKGQWYPVCSTASSWAIDACQSESGQSLTTMPEIETVPVSDFKGYYAKESGQNQIEMVKDAQCSAVFVRCPPLTCGTRVLFRTSFFNGNITNNNIQKRDMNERDEDAASFNKLYQQTLELLNANSEEYTKSSSEEQNENNDTFVGLQSRVVGGRASQPTAWPSLVAIYRDGQFHCGGVIIRESYVITAAHCMEKYQTHYFEIQAGILRRFSFSPMTQSRMAKYVIIYSTFENQHMQNDIAIIMLDRPLLFNRWVRQTCLPELNTAGSEWKNGPTPKSKCIAIGWGATKEYGPDPDNLREVEVPILPNCKRIIDQNHATICAGFYEGGYDACQGDSGGPLMCRNPKLESQWYVAGIISHGEGCARPNEPGVYTKVSYFMEWIQQIIAILENSSNLTGNKPLTSCPGFSCQSGRCLPIEKRCNRVIDCLDGEDELLCDADYARNSNTDDEMTKSQADVSSAIENSARKEGIPLSPTRFFYNIQMQTDSNETDFTSDENSDSTTDMPEMMPNIKLTFTCKNLIQTITINKRCDKHLDCEDGTDEEDCTCRDYLLNFQPTAICDGHMDCDDETDEIYCDICQENEFHCSRSGKCIPITKKCNTEYDCPLNEDEIDCLALTDGKYINLDNDNRPALNMEGLLSRHYKRVWYTQCLSSDTLDNITTMSTIGRNLCVYLGFANVQSVDKVAVNTTMLKTKYWKNSTTPLRYETELLSRVEASIDDETCTTLRIRCRPVLSSSADSYLTVDPRTGNHIYQWPWLAVIFVDGRYRCLALLLEPDWLLSSSSCTEDIKLSVNYTTALLGQSRSFLYVDGPYQQIHVVDEIVDVKISDVSLLHLKTAVNITRYVQPLFLEKKIYPPAENDLCVAVGVDKQQVIQSIFLQPILENCAKCYRCFIEAAGSKCPDNETFSDWSGMVFCRSEAGWYLAAVFHKNDLCNSQGMRNLTSIDYIHAFLTQASEKKLQPIPEAICDGVRCTIGQCVPWNQVCDGITHCRDGADETNALCSRVTQQIRSSGTNFKCKKSQIQCKNGGCISKSEFCDGKVDCMDGTDEPLKCTCAEYLRLTQPERLCDNVRHCLDKSDESPEMCRCTEANFKCNGENTNTTCISKDFVCDGDNDCPNGEDEIECMKLEESTEGSGRGEVMRRSYGVWHSQCFSSLIESQEEINIICQKMNYTEGTIDHENQTSKEPAVPLRDDFYMIRLSPNMWVTMRDDRPLISLVQAEEPCYRLFVKCT